ncbi:type II toxin-antitoxin system HicA family toxin [Candidatus Nitrotoga sp. 1052]|uniref:type II toxin-antitoxin system HicA family toxin n=1 Tax=Candidatus Nitrotoga sp. 1052 TaxID=2886964 RepID=UPI001EF6EB1F|nr:type II toxin-antitoxin system HicA family toxin [Candidatus Nitrotoga sp. 1052]
MAELYSSNTIVNILLRHGFIFISQKSSHKKFRKGERTVIVPDPKKKIPLGTFASIPRQSGLSKEDFK